MRIRDLVDWPPDKFEADGTVDDCPQGAKYLIRAATFIPTTQSQSAPGHIIIQLEADKTEARCSTRIRVSDMTTGRLIAATLARCRGLSLEQAGNRRIEENPKV